MEKQKGPLVSHDTYLVFWLDGPKILFDRINKYVSCTNSFSWETKPSHTFMTVFNNNRAQFDGLGLGLFIISNGWLYTGGSKIERSTLNWNNFKHNWDIDLKPTGACRKTLEVFLVWLLHPLLHQSPVDNEKATFEKSPLWESHAKIWGSLISTFWCGKTCFLD